jgi:tetratricopeptide (TPR) repeat protein
VKAASLDPEALADLASKALAEGTEEQALPQLEKAAEAAKADARLWQWTALLHRALDEHEDALRAFEEAARLAPADASIAHGHARVALEAGLDARALFDLALKLKPAGDVILGRAAARYAMGEGEAAAAELAAVLKTNPNWAQGHAQWAQLVAMIGKPERATDTINAALEVLPRDVQLWQAAIQILTRAERHSEAWTRADDAIAATGQASIFALARAAAMSDSGALERAGAAFMQLPEPASVSHAVHLARHLIRAEEWHRLSDLTDRWMQGDDAHHFWPYASICWRKTDDARAQWLEGDERLVKAFDLTSDLPPIESLAACLRSLHAKSGRFLDQSVRGGTQTDGPLFARLEPEIQALRKAIVSAVERYRASLPPIDPGHPMLRHRRDGRVRFSGSWSVRLQGAGFHSNHVHPQGWISSAFYVAVPNDLRGEEGWLTLREPQAELGVQMPPLSRIAPKPCQLVLFPSMMWHGTLPFTSGERMTVAFDIAPPR